MEAKKGFTLIELIISSLIISVVSIAIYSVFSGGISAWRRAKNIRDDDRNLRLVSETFARELRNAFKFSKLPFKGDKDSISFASVWEYFSEGEPPGYALGRATYFLNQENIFCRKQQTYQELFQEDETGTVKKLIPGVLELNFSYLGFDEEDQSYQWQDTWPKTGQEGEEEAVENQDEEDDRQTEEEKLELPKAVKIEVKAEEADFSKTIMIPVGK